MHILVGLQMVGLQLNYFMGSWQIILLSGSNTAVDNAYFGRSPNGWITTELFYG